MSELFSRVLDPGRDLLARTDRVLAACGAPAGHPVLSLIARLGVLPGEALEFAAALRPELLLEQAAALPRVVQLPSPPPTWTGPAAEAFNARWRELGARQSELAVRLEETSAYATAVADWMTGLRAEFAVALTAVLGSAEAVAVKMGAARTDGVDPREVVLAAAIVGRRVLAAVTFFDLADWPSRLAGATGDGPWITPEWCGGPGRGFSVPLREPTGLPPAHP